MSPFALRQAVAASAILLAAATAASAQDCDGSREAAQTALAVYLEALLDLKTAEFRVDRISEWRDQHDAPRLMGDKLREARRDIASYRPVAELAETDFEAAAYKAQEDCSDG